MDDERAKDVPPDRRDEGEYDSGALTGDVAETSGGTVEGALGSAPEGGGGGEPARDDG